MREGNMLKTEKIVQIKTSVGRHLRVIREHYIREDVPCYSSMCIDGCNNELSGRLVSVLPKDVTHYVVPDCTLARDYLELLEIPEITAIIFLQTVANSVQHDGSRRLHRRLMNLVHDPHKKSIVFHNEYQRYAYCVRKTGETLQQWQARSVYEGAVWYYHHLAGQIPIVVLTSDNYLLDTYGSQTQGVFVITLDQYLKTFWADLQQAHSLHSSLCAALNDAKTKVTSEAEGYLPSDVLEAGLKVGRFLQGRLNVNKHNSQNEAFVTPSGTKSKDSVFSSDVLISGSAARNHAVHGDVVVVEVLPRTQWAGRTLALTTTNQDETSENSETSHTMPTGRVVGVSQRGWRDYVATFGPEEETQRKAGKVLVLPWDRRVPKIRISTSQVDALRDHRITVRIDSWEFDSQYPNGHFVRSLGTMGDLETETAAILIENSITNATPFSEAQLRELPVNTWDQHWEMDPSEIARRRDLRDSHLIFSIDPKGCEDVDDTLSVRKLENGNLELGVHIADVTYFVPPNSLTDLEARSRATTVYLADRRYDMLPEVLSADLCSLLGGVDRYAMSVIWELDSNYEVVDVWYGRSLIRSKYKLFYEIAQQMYDNAPVDTLVSNIPELQDLGPEELTARVEELRWAVSTLIDVARAINAKRTSGGALVLEGVEVQVQFTDKSRKTIEDLLPKQAMEIHETIAECMIFANHWVAKKICQAFPNQALLRHHPLPRQDHFDTLIQCAKSKGFTVDTSTNKALAESLDRCVDANDPYVNKLLRSLATQAMSNAEYFSTGSLSRDQFFHYGLALDYYTHFTSPIRRYADVVVHRLLLCALEQEDRNKLPGNKELNEMSQHINTKHRAAQYAQKESLQLFQMLFFSAQPQDDNISHFADAVIFQLRLNGFLAFLPRYGLKGAVYLRSKDHQVVYVTSEGIPEWTAGSLVTTDQTVTVDSVLGSQTYRLFDHVTVRIKVQESHAHASSVQLSLVANTPYDQEEMTDSTKAAKTHMIQTVRAAASRDRAGREEEADLLALGAAFPKLKAEYGQTPDHSSLYHLFLKFKEQALLDV